LAVPDGDGRNCGEEDGLGERHVCGLFVSGVVFGMGDW
jgi:hypothetical protein